MQVTLTANACTIQREPHDKRYSGITAESRILYVLKNALNSQGKTLIKKRMYKDGHLWGDNQSQYLRSKDHTKGIMIYDPDYAIRDIGKAFNSGEPVRLMITNY